MTQPYENKSIDDAWLVNVTLFRPGLVDLDGAMIAGVVALGLALLLLASPLLSRESMMRKPLSSSFAMLITPSLVLLAPRWYGTWTSTDIIPALMWTLLAFLYLRHCERLEGSEERRKDLVLLWVLTSYAITVKVSFLPAMLLPMLASIRDLRVNGLSRSTRVALHVSWMILTIWVVCNLLVSGCVVYPVAFTCVDTFPWAVDSALATAEKNWIVSWARRPGAFYNENLSSWTWLTDWWLQNSGAWLAGFFLKATTAITLISLTLRLVVSKTGNIYPYNASHEKSKALGGLLLTVVAALGFWFLTAPDPRFATALVLVFAFLPGTYILREAVSDIPRVLFHGGWVLSCSFLVLWSLKDLNQLRQSPVWLRAEESIPKPAVRTQMMGELLVNVPINGDQCWRARLPCTPYPGIAIMPVEAGRHLQLRRIRVKP